MHGSNTPSFPLLLAAGLLLVNSAPAPRAAAREASMKVTEASAAPLDSFPVPPHCIPSWVIDASGIRRLPDRCFEAVSPASNTAAPPSSVTLGPTPAAAARRTETTAARSRQRSAKSCSKPSYVDAKGVQRLRPECL